jgi:serine phosphatase RsbU (regulator of sigma subunit)
LTDCSVLKLEANYHAKEVTEVEWAGANNPLWIVEKRNAEKWELSEIKPDKQPIGKSDIRKPFTPHKISLSKGSMLYLFTDGYADQFGGDKGKKLTKARFKEYLIEIAALSAAEQQEKLHQYFLNYKKKEEQVDDVCVIGIRI